MTDEYKFSTIIKVNISDINYGGHLGNDRYLSIFQEARLQYLNQFGYSEISIGDDVSLIMRQAMVDFKAEAFWNDELKVYARISKIESRKFFFEYMIVKNKEQDTSVATGYTLMLGYDYKEKKLKKLPLEFVNKIRQFEQIS